MNAQNSNEVWRTIFSVLQQAGQRELTRRLEELPLADILPERDKMIRFSEIETHLQAGEYLLELTNAEGDKEFFYMAILNEQQR